MGKPQSEMAAYDNKNLLKAIILGKTVLRG
jgi:hypothetical protein